MNVFEQQNFDLIFGVGGLLRHQQNIDPRFVLV
jgi:hypothetical protein